MNFGALPKRKNTNIDYQAHIRSIEKSYEVRKRWF